MKQKILLCLTFWVLLGAFGKAESQKLPKDLVFYKGYSKYTKAYFVLIVNEKAGVLTYLFEGKHGFQTTACIRSTNYVPDVSPDGYTRFDLGYHFEVFILSKYGGSLCEQELLSSISGVENETYNFRFVGGLKRLNKNQLSFIGGDDYSGNLCLHTWLPPMMGGNFPSYLKKTNRIRYGKFFKGDRKKLKRAIAALCEGKPFEEVDAILREGEE
ncbi:hypothetical protein AAG747_13975 [Rapidithrix thailandica]|uniref:Uncharacterized protein n=1 Tax=Rapidithrix thailandica TaxID=413964 RepID=A0AAW9RVW8_9BACT